MPSPRLFGLGASKLPAETGIADLEGASGGGPRGTALVAYLRQILGGDRARKRPVEAQPGE
jgi:hypothetical protein